MQPPFQRSVELSTADLATFAEKTSDCCSLSYECKNLVGRGFDRRCLGSLVEERPLPIRRRSSSLREISCSSFRFRVLE